MDHQKTEIGRPSTAPRLQQITVDDFVEGVRAHVRAEAIRLGVDPTAATKAGEGKAVSARLVAVFAQCGRIDPPTAYEALVELDRAFTGRQNAPERQPVHGFGSDSVCYGVGDEEGVIMLAALGRLRLNRDLPVSIAHVAALLGQSISNARKLARDGILRTLKADDKRGNGRDFTVSPTSARSVLGKRGVPGFAES